MGLTLKEGETGASLGRLSAPMQQSYLADHLFFLLPGFFFLAAFMLSTKLGYLRPAFFAARFALAFRLGESLFDFLPAFFFGLAFFQGGFLTIDILHCTHVQRDCLKPVPGSSRRYEITQQSSSKDRTLATSRLRAAVILVAALNRRLHENICLYHIDGCVHRRNSRATE